MLPRSTWKASARWPAKTSLLPSLCTAALARSAYFGVLRMPTLTGGQARLEPSTLLCPFAIRVTE